MKPLKKLLDNLVPSPDDIVGEDKSPDVREIKKAKYGSYFGEEPKKTYSTLEDRPEASYDFRDTNVVPQSQPPGWNAGTNPIPYTRPKGLSAPWVQGTASARNATEDMDIQNERDFEKLPHSQQVRHKERTGGKAMPMGKYGPSFNLGAGIAASLSALTALLPDNSTRKPNLEEPLAYNPYAYGTGSQAIMKAGGDLSPAKAKEMLRDGKANGKKLTKKQKRYFGWVASGKAEAGMAMEPHPTTPKKNTYYNDLVNKSLLAGTNPVTHIPGRALVNENMGEIVDAINLFNARPESKGLTGEQRISAFYNWNTGNQKVEGWKNILKNINYTPAIDTRFTPSVDVQGKDAVAKNLAKYESGGTVNPYDGGTQIFSGPSHAQGGIDISYRGNQVEVEGGETAVKDPMGNLTIFGNMTVPGTKKKFKTISKELAEAEDKLVVLKDNGVAAINDTDFVNKNDKFKFNAGRVMTMGAEIGQKKVAEKKQMLAALQRAMLDTAQEFNLDPIALSEGDQRKAKKGMFLDYRNGGDPEKKKKESRAVRHNNPGNIKWNPTLKWMKALGAVPGEPATDGGRFAKFPSLEAGMKAIRTNLKMGYGNYEVGEGLKRWTNGPGYSIPLGDLRGKKIKDLGPEEVDKLVNMITYGEDGRYYQKTPDPVAPSTPGVKAPTSVEAPYPDVVFKQLPKTNLTYQDPVKPTPEEVAPPPLPGISYQDPQPLPSDARKFNPLQIVPELVAFAQNDEEMVPLQSYQPNLYQPYQVTFQDRINRNQGAFNQVAQQAGNNPEALAILASQLYDANSQVAGEQFRTNQGIANEVTNKNVGILNDAELKNLGLADQQFVRQSQAKSNTKQQTNVILNSIRDKFAQHSLDNQRLKLYENLYDFRFGPDQTAEYMGGPAPLNFNGSPIGMQGQNYATQTVKEYNKAGELTKTRVRQPSVLDQKVKEETLKQKRSKNFWDRIF